MKSRLLHITTVAFLVLISGASAVQAAAIDWVTIGSPGNAPDGNGLGAVAYEYQIGKYEVTNAQYAAFLNAVGQENAPYQLLHPGQTEITRSGAPGSFVYSVQAGRENHPVTRVIWSSTLRFANWLHNGQPVGPVGPETTERGSYTLDGATTFADLQHVVRSPGATVVLPTADEWYKAAAYDPTTSSYYLYAASSNDKPSNERDPAGTNNANYGNSGAGKTDVGFFAASPSPWGTFDQNGNAAELLDEITIADEGWMRRGSAYNSGRDSIDQLGIASPFYYSGINAGVGFRVAQLTAVPEPSAMVLLALGGVSLALRRR